MPVEVLRTLTLDDDGEPKRSFNGGELINFHMDCRLFDIPDETEVRVTFHLKYQQNVGVGTGRHMFVFMPVHFWQFNWTCSPGYWFFWSNWRLPEADPGLPHMPRADWETWIFSEHWRMRSWRGIWELTGLFAPKDPRLGDFDHSRERWLYQILYPPF